MNHNVLYQLIVYSNCIKQFYKTFLQTIIIVYVIDFLATYNIPLYLKIIYRCVINKFLSGILCKTFYVYIELNILPIGIY